MILNDQPGNQIKIINGLHAVRRPDQFSLFAGKQTGEILFPELRHNSLHRLIDQSVIAIHIRAVLSFGIK